MTVLSIGAAQHVLSAKASQLMYPCYQFITMSSLFSLCALQRPGRSRSEPTLGSNLHLKRSLTLQQGCCADCLSIMLPLLQYQASLGRPVMQFVTQAPGQQTMVAQVSAAAAVGPQPSADSSAC